MTILEGIKAALYAIAGAALAALFCWLVVIPLERNDARRGYVVEARATAAEAKSAELQRQVNAGQLVISSYQEIAKNDRARDAQTAADTDIRIKEYEKRLEAAGRSWHLDQSDVDELLKP